MTQENPDTDGVEIVLVAVTVTRSGGIAGLRRTWRAEPDSAEAPQWIALIDECPWDAVDEGVARTTRGADRYVWHVDARLGEAERVAALADPDVRGPWRQLIDAVRAAASDSPRGAP